MKVLLVYSGNHHDGGCTNVFVTEQGNALIQAGIDVSYFTIQGKGMFGYLSNLRRLKQTIRAEKPDLVHAHYGMSGALAVLQRLVPVVTTYHNGETLTCMGRLSSKLALRHSAYNIFVAQHIYDLLTPKPKRYTILPCGIWLSQQPLIPKDEARAALGLPTDKPNILFGGAFSNLRKNVALAREAIQRLPFDVNLIEMKGWNRKQVNQLFCACDMLLLPTKSEGSPQVVKEALACNCPVVATNVADIPYLLLGVKNSYATDFDPQEIANKIVEVLDDGGRSDGRQRIETLQLDNTFVAEKLINIYRSVLHIDTVSTKKLDVLAFYLPQFYPTPENNTWFGVGFTEWTNVGKSKPLFKGHYQPKVPTDLGYYDLRLPEVRQAQADLAKQAGITAFCYYHYWFGNGREMLEMPLNQVVALGEPNFPFCVCWANHTWYKKTWDAQRSVLDKKQLLRVTYGGETEWRRHFDDLLHIFRDKRYYRIDGRLVFVFYRIEDIPHVDQMQQCWQQWAQQAGLGGFYFMSYVDDVMRLQHKAHALCEQVVLCCKNEIDSFGATAKLRKGSRFARMVLSEMFGHSLNVHNYASIRSRLLSEHFSEENVVPTLLPNFDNTPRRGKGAMVLDEATPEQFYLHSKEVFAYLRNKKKPIAFVKSWNEWGEGNYLEPDIKYGHGYIDALRRAIDEFNADRTS